MHHSPLCCRVFFFPLYQCSHSSPTHQSISPRSQQLPFKHDCLPGTELRAGDPVIKKAEDLPSIEHAVHRRQAKNNRHNRSHDQGSATRETCKAPWVKGRKAGPLTVCKERSARTSDAIPGRIGRYPGVPQIILPTDSGEEMGTTS